MATLTLSNVPATLEPALRVALAEAPLDTLVAGTGTPPVGRFLEIKQNEWDDAVEAIKTALRKRLQEE